MSFVNQKDGERCSFTIRSVERSGIVCDKPSTRCRPIWAWVLAAMMRDSIPLHGTRQRMPHHTTENHIRFPTDAPEKPGLAPLLLRPSPLPGLFALVWSSSDAVASGILISLLRHPPDTSLSRRNLLWKTFFDLLPPGRDEYVTEKYAFEIESLLEQWSDGTQEIRPRPFRRLAKFLDASIEGSALGLRQGNHAPHGRRHRDREETFATEIVPGRERFLAGDPDLAGSGLDAWKRRNSRLRYRRNRECSPDRPLGYSI